MEGEARRAYGGEASHHPPRLFAPLFPQSLFPLKAKPPHLHYDKKNKNLHPCPKGQAKREAGAFLCGGATSLFFFF